MQAFQWEQKDQQTPFWIHMIAGSCAGITQHLSMLPLDNIKTHYQAGSHFKLGQIVKSIYETGGLINFYSGSSIVAIGCIPAHAIYFSIYEKAKQILKCDHDDKHHRFAIVGALAALFHDMIMTPTQVIKQRLQLYRTQIKWISTHELIAQIYKKEGLISFYRSFGINYLMNMPFSSLIILMNQKLKKLFNVKQNNHHFNYYLCGGIAGGLASIPSTPFDVIKTRLNTQICLNTDCQKKQNCCQNIKLNADKSSVLQSQLKSDIRYHNILDTTARIYQQQGFIGFFSGLKMRITIQAFSSAIAWGTYQLIKNKLSNRMTYVY